MSRILLKGGRVIDPDCGRDQVADILIEGGRIAAVEPGLAADDAQIIDLSGLVAAPGLVDLHAHLREPGQEWKEDIESGSHSAAAGGFTTVAAMANTDPPADKATGIEYVLGRAARIGVCRVRPVGAVTKALAGRELAEIGEMRAAGAVALSDDGKPVMDAEVMRCALEYTQMFDLPIVSHCEDHNLAAGGVMHRGLVSTVLGLRGMPREAEEIMVARDLALAAMTGGRLHIAHVSTAGSVELIRRARAAGIAVTAEVTPHHLLLTDAAVRESGYDSNTKMNPPLRTEADRRALLAGLLDGTIDCIATDHAPHHRDDKEVEFDLAAFGIVGLETALPLTVTHLVGQQGLSLPEAVARLSTLPARIFGLEAGTLAPGRPADLVVFDPREERPVEPERFASKGRNTPFGGWVLRGWPSMTFLGGRQVYVRPDAGHIPQGT